MIHKKIKYTVVFNRKKRLNKDGTALIYIRAHQQQKDYFDPTGIWIEEKYWDKANRKVKHTHPNQFKYNELIYKQLQAMEAYEIKMINRLENGFPIRRLHEYKNDSSLEEPQSFTDFYKQEMEASRATKEPATIKDYGTTFNKLKSFRVNIYFEDINFDLAVAFDRYLSKFDYDINYIKKQHKNLRTFVNLAIKKRKIKPDQNPYLYFSPKSREPDRVFLTVEELRKIEDLQFSEDFCYMEQIKDIFLISAYTGCRVSDLLRLNKSCFTETNKGLILNLRSKKGAKPLTLPLYLLFKESGKVKSKVESIIYKYILSQNLIHHERENQNIPFFSITSQYYNRRLKELAKRVGIKKNLTSHVGRRTFATIMATKVQMPVVQKLLNHSTLSMTQIYIRLGNKAVENELEKIKWD